MFSRHYGQYIEVKGFFLDRCREKDLIVSLLHCIRIASRKKQVGSQGKPVVAGGSGSEALQTKSPL